MRKTWLCIMTIVFTLFAASFLITAYAGDTTQKLCNNNICDIRAETHSPSLSAPDNHKQAAPALNESTINNIDTSIINSLSHSNLAYFSLLLLFMGFLLAFSPCVLPLIILISGFLNQSNEISYTRSISLSLTFVMALSLTLAIVGVLAASFGVYLNAYTQNPWVIGSFSLLLTFLSLSLLGFYKITLPVRLQHATARLNKLQSNYQYIEVILMGVGATLIMSPCICAPLVALLTYVIETGSIFTGAISLSFFGLGMGLPLLVATIVQKHIFPKPGKWQFILKFSYGLLLIAIAIFIAGRILPHSLIILFWCLLIIFTAYFISSIDEERIKPFIILMKTVSSVALAYGLLLFAGFFLGNYTLTDPLHIKYVNVQQSLRFDQISGVNSLQNSIDNAKNFKLNTLVIFTTDWCTECTSLKNTLMNNEELTPLLRHFMLLEVNITNNTPPIKDLERIYRVSGTPQIIFFDTAGELSTTNIIGNQNLNVIKDTLQSILNKQ